MARSNFDHQIPKFTIESVTPVSQDQIEGILSSFDLKAEDVQLEVQKNSSLIAGMRVSYQGKVLDLSLQNKLNKIKES